MIILKAIIMCHMGAPGWHSVAMVITFPSQQEVSGFEPAACCLHVLMWASSGCCGFLPRPKDMRWP